MVARLPAYRSCITHSLAEPAVALALQAEENTGSWIVDRDLLATLEGHPIWVDPDLAKLARARGHATTLIETYRRHGLKLFDRLKGDFSLAVLDRASERALLAIDRMGIQPLCYAHPAPGILVFGATTDTVRAHPAVGASIRLQAVYDFLYFIDRIPAPDTVYEEQSKLPPGHYLLFEKGEVQLKPYWRMPYAADRARRKDELAADLLRHLRAALAGSLDGENFDKVGTFLSGGLDSSTILGLLAEAAPRPKSFTIGFGVEGFDEVPYAKVAANHFESVHHVYYVGPADVVAAIPKVAEIYDEPFANSSAIPAYYCALHAKEAGVDVLLAGDGGDELFAGNSRYRDDAVFDHYGLIPDALRKGVIEPLLNGVPGLNRIPVMRKLRRYVSLAKRSVAERLTCNNIYSSRSPEAIFTEEALSAMSLGAPAALADEIYEETASEAKLHRMMHLDLRITLADSDLRKVSRMCELAGLRVRFPFLNDAIVEFSATIPPELLIEGGRLRGFYKEALGDFLPREILTKKKKGFGLPYLELVRTYEPLNQLVCDSLQSLKKRGYFRGAFLDSATDRLHAGGFHGLGDIKEGVVWDLMMLEMWFESRAIS